MTQGETLFYLREIHSHWCASNVSLDKLAELQAARLIEFDGSPFPSVRLTSEGARLKSLGRRQADHGGLSLTGKPKTAGRRPRRKQLAHVKPLA